MSVTTPSTSSPPLAETLLSPRPSAFQRIRPILDVMGLDCRGVGAVGRLHPAVQRRALHLSVADCGVRSLWLGVSVASSERSCGDPGRSPGGRDDRGASQDSSSRLVMVSSRFINRSDLPWVVGIQTIPKVAIALPDAGLVRGSASSPRS